MDYTYQVQKREIAVKKGYQVALRGESDSEGDQNPDNVALNAYTDALDMGMGAEMYLDNDVRKEPRLLKDKAKTEQNRIMG